MRIAETVLPRLDQHEQTAIGKEPPEKPARPQFPGQRQQRTAAALTGLAFQQVAMRQKGGDLQAGDIDEQGFARIAARICLGTGTFEVTGANVVERPQRSPGHPVARSPAVAKPHHPL